MDSDRIKQEFTRKLSEVASKFEKENLASLKFLCKDVIPAGCLEKVPDAETLFKELEQRNKLGPKKLELLIEQLKHIGRHDLAVDLESFSDKLSTESKGFEPEKSLNISKDESLEGQLEKAQNFSSRGRAEFQAERFEKACESYTQAISNCPQQCTKNKQKYFINRAACLIKMRRFEAAEEDCNEALLLNPHNVKAKFRRAQALKGMDQFDEAFEELQELKEQKPKDNSIIKLYEEVANKIEDISRDVEMMARSGNKYHASAEYSFARMKYTEALMICPKSNSRKKENLLFRRACCFLKEKNYKASWSDCEEALRIAEEVNPKVLYIQMKCCENLEMSKDAYKIAKKLLQAGYKVTEAKGTIERILLKESEIKSKQREQLEEDPSHQCEVTKEDLDPECETTPVLHDTLPCVLGSSDTSFQSRNENKARVESPVNKNNCRIEVRSSQSVEDLKGEFFAHCKDNTTGRENEGDEGRSKQDSVKKVNLTGTNTSTSKVVSNLRILFICDKWCCWYQDISCVSRYLSRSLANLDVRVACLVLDVTNQEKVKAERDGVFVIKASSQPGIPNGSPQLLFLHDTYPFDIDLVIGHSTVTGAAAAHQAKKLNCKRLHIFHTVPGEEENCQSTREDIEERRTNELELGLTADFVGAIGPLLRDEWSASLNRQVIEVIPGLPEAEQRNSIATPQCRCMFLGKLCKDQLQCLNEAAQGLAKCKKRNQAIKLLVRGFEQEEVDEVEETLKSNYSPEHVKVEVKRFDVSRELVEVDIRGVSLVLMPFCSDNFGIMALDAFAAGVPVLLNSSCGVSQVIRDHLDSKFLEFVIEADEDDWTEAIDKVLDDRDRAFQLASNLRMEWIRTFSWENTTKSLLDILLSSGDFPICSPPNLCSKLAPPSCPQEAIQFVENELCLTDKRQKHVLFVSPQDKEKSPFIKQLVLVPWVTVFDFDVNSVRSGCLASSDSYCQNAAIKICRILPPGPGDEMKKHSVTLPNGVPWVLIEGLPESRRNVVNNLKWAREYFVALEKSYPLPITFVILWDSNEENAVLCRKLCKLVTLVESSSLRNQVKLAIVSTGDTIDRNLQDTAVDWEVLITELKLEDFCNAILSCATSQQLGSEEHDFDLPAAGSEKVKVVPPSLRWINAEFDVLYLSAGNHPDFGEHDALHFYRGGTISWYALRNGYAIEREGLKAIKEKIDDLLVRAGTMRLKMPHKRGTGGTTSARKILFDYHWKYPCVCLRPGNRSEVVQAIRHLAKLTNLPVLVLVDCKQVEGEEFDLDILYTSLSNNRVPCLLLEVCHLQQSKGSSGKHSSLQSGSQQTQTICLADTLSDREADDFVKVYSYQRQNKMKKLQKLRVGDISELQIPFYYALVTFEEDFTALEPFVRDCLQNLHERERHVLLFLAMAHHYGHNALNASVFAEILQVSRRQVVLLDSYLQESSQHLLLEEDGKWRPRHDIIAVEMLRQLVSAKSSCSSEQINTANWLKHLAEIAIECISHMPEAVVSDMLLNRVTDEQSYKYFSPLINDIPDVEDAISVFEKAISVFPDNLFFKVHLGRFYSIEKKMAGFDLAIKYTDAGITCAQGIASRTVRGQFAQMKGVVHSRQVGYMINQGCELSKIIETAEEGVRHFSRATSLSPDVVDGYIPQVRMLCKVFEYVGQITDGGFLEYLQLPDAAPFIVDGISSAFDTLDCVPDSDEYGYWRMRLVCVSKRSKYHSTAEDISNIKEVLDVLNRIKGRSASIAPINRRIVRMRMELCQKENKPLHLIAEDLLTLLNEALKFDSKIESTMCLWVVVAPHVPVDLPTAETKIFQWCLTEKSVRSFLYKYIIACIHVLEGGSKHYNEIMKNAFEDLIGAIRAINRADIGRCRHPDRPVVLLGKQSRGMMSQLVVIDDKSSHFKDVRLKRCLPSNHVQRLRQLTGIITETSAKVGNIRVNNLLDVSFRADLCEPPLDSDVFCHRKVKFYLAFNFFGSDAYNVKLVAD